MEFIREIKKMKIYIKLIFILSICFLTIYSSNLIATKYPKIFNKNNGDIYIAKLIPSNVKIVRLEIEMFDDTSKDYYDITNISFNGQSISLLNADSNGYRGRKYYQLKPGTYVIRWSITTNKPKVWPNSKTLEKTIDITDINPYMHIIINGENISIF